MSTIFDLLYREFCRARLAEMRKQLLIPVASDEILEAHRKGDDPAGPGDRVVVGATEPQRKNPQPSDGQDS